MKLKYNADTQLVFQIGDPIEHSCSGFLHNTMYDIANVNAVCVMVKIKKGELPQFIESVKLLGANGFDITTPHKTDIIQYLDECDDGSRIFKCVNHVKLREGKLIGIGLDGVGMGLAIENLTGGPGSLKGSNVLIIGAGAVAGPISADLSERGAKSIFVANRTVDKAEYITKQLNNMYEIKTGFGKLENNYLSYCAPESDIIVQCTSLGLPGHSGSFESFDFMKKLPRHCIVTDVLYPTTDFLEAAKSLGLKTINGMGMLLHQQIAMIDFRFGIKLNTNCLDIAEESLVAAIAIRELHEQRKANKKTK